MISSPASAEGAPPAKAFEDVRDSRTVFADGLAARLRSGRPAVKVQPPTPKIALTSRTI